VAPCCIIHPEATKVIMLIIYQSQTSRPKDIRSRSVTYHSLVFNKGLRQDDDLEDNKNKNHEVNVIWLL
jgi:hypothetical protein